jgi:hypothetical protein
MAEVLTERLPTGVNVEVVDRMFGVRDRDVMTVPYPSVLLACRRVTLDGQYQPPVATGQFAAVCLSRFEDQTEAEEVTAGDSAMNLAALVAAYVESERWEGLAFSSASRVRIDTLASQQLTEKEISGWAVLWDQDFEITLPAAPAEQFSKLGIVAIMGDANTPDVEGLYVRPEEP